MIEQNVSSGHAPAHLRDRFLKLLKAGEYGEELNALAGKLWNCTDIIAGSDCNWLDVQVGSTYAQLARRIRSAG